MSAKDRYVPIALAAVAFTATVAVLLHRQTDNAPSSPPSRAQARALTAASAFQPVNPPRPAQREQWAAPGNFAPTRVAPEESAAPAASTSSVVDDADTELPVTMSFRHAPGHEGIEGGLANAAEHALEVTATLQAGTRDQQQVEFTVDAGAGHRIGGQDGLQIHSGDRITVHSTPYRDRVFTVP